jgi:probable rRNA maturation factor
MIMPSEPPQAPVCSPSNRPASPPDVTLAAEPPQRLCLTLLAKDGDWGRFGAVDAAIKLAGVGLQQAPQVALAGGREASVVLGNDALVQALNAAYRGKDVPTNVLAFPFQRPRGGPPEADAYLGDVVLAAETILREADERGIEPVHHLQHLLVHGLLHLLGYDHETAAAAEKMERLETAVLARIGVADPYGA